VTAGEIRSPVEVEAQESLTGDAQNPDEAQEAAEQAPGISPASNENPFTTRQLLRLDEALRQADQQTGLIFSVYVGDLEEPTRKTAEALHQELTGGDRAVLVAVSPNQRLLEIVTGNEARKRISDRDAKLAALSMAASFAGGDLAGGILAGLDQLASHAGRS
jgi:uncharacterized membrane protein YgcG